MKLVAPVAIGLVVILLLVIFLRPTQTTQLKEFEERTLEREVITEEERAQLVTVYDGVRVSENSTELDMSGRGLEGSLKAEIRHVTMLEELYLSDNQFTGLPAEVGQLSALRILDLSNNPFTGLPHELGNLQNLEELNLVGTQYSEFDLEKISERLPASTVVITEIAVATSTETFEIQGR